jgi:ribosome-associated protein
MTEPIDFQLRGDFIALASLLKVTGVANSGGHAKTLIGNALVRADGQVELRKTCKIRAGQLVTVGATTIRVLPPSQSG